MYGAAALAGLGLRGGLAAVLSYLLVHHYKGRVENTKAYIPEIECQTNGGTSGECVPLVYCARYFNSLDYLAQSKCKLSQKNFGVCCPLPEPPLKDPVKYLEFVVPVYNKSHNNHLDISISDLNYASEAALQEQVKRKSFERSLIRRDLILHKGSSAYLHSKLFKTTKKIFNMGSNSTLVLYASAELVKKFNLNKQQTLVALTNFKVSDTIIKGTCPLDLQCLDLKNKYRSIDGTCNNFNNRDWGSTGSTLKRLLVQEYEDGLSTIRLAKSSKPLPSARLVSTTTHYYKPIIDLNFTLALMQWGQFLDHDIAHTPISKGTDLSDITCCRDGRFLKKNQIHPECLPISIPDDDSFYKRHNQSCMEFVRSMPAIRPLCTFGPREQMNQVTSYIDASTVYGSTNEEAKKLRSFKKGKLKQRGRQLLPRDTATCQSDDTQQLSCFRAGDTRVNEQPQLVIMHTMWVRQHNKFVARLHKLNPHWNDQRLYQETRRIIIAQIQHITYNEFLPVLLGRDLVELYDLIPRRHDYFYGYKDDVDATIINSFATAAYRFGHSLVPGNLKLLKKDFKEHSEVRMSSVQFRPYILYQRFSFSAFVRGLVKQPSLRRDKFFTPQLTNHLFSADKKFGMDLVSLNIQRGRDHGLPGYTYWREYCGLKPIVRWKDLLEDIDVEAARELQLVYDHIDDIDLFVGGISERPAKGTILGPTFLCIIAKQFVALKIGDRFYYENAPAKEAKHSSIAFTEHQLRQLRRTSLSRVICDNGGNIPKIQPLAFIRDRSINNLASCSNYLKMPRINLFPWKEVPGY